MQDETERQRQRQNQQQMEMQVRQAHLQQRQLQRQMRQRSEQEQEQGPIRNSRGLYRFPRNEQVLPNYRRHAFRAEEEEEEERGLSKKQLGLLPRSKHTGKVDKCTICLDDIIEGN